MLKNLEEGIKYFERRDKIEQDKMETDLRIKELLVKIDRLEKREDPQDVELRVTKATTEHQEKLEKHHEKLRKL
jgi:cytochrome c-type biogenesis protein CcmE